MSSSANIRPKGGALCGSSREKGNIVRRWSDGGGDQTSVDPPRPALRCHGTGSLLPCMAARACSVPLRLRSPAPQSACLRNAAPAIRGSRVSHYQLQAGLFSASISTRVRQVAGSDSGPGLTLAKQLVSNHIAPMLSSVSTSRVNSAEAGPSHHHFGSQSRRGRVLS